MVEQSIQSWCDSSSGHKGSLKGEEGREPHHSREGKTLKRDDGAVEDRGWWDQS